MIDRYGAVAGIEIDRENGSTGITPTPVPLVHHIVWPGIESRPTTSRIAHANSTTLSVWILHSVGHLVSIPRF
jgi:hypothetical protein